MQPSRFLIILLASASLTACSTQAQRMFSQLQQNDKEVGEKFQKCVSDFESANKELSEKFFRRVVKGDDDPERYSKMLDKNTIDSEFRETALAVFNKANCPDKYAQDLNRVSPLLSAVWLETLQERDRTRIAFLEGKISFGEYNTKAKDLKADHMRRIQEANQKITAGLESQHMAEVQQRQAAAQAFSASMAQQAQIQNENLQRMLDRQAINRPINTTCNRIGNTINCNSF